ncbi:MAG TPA: MFS transporter [Verrucomicrobiae bacterium]|nr:MFS transporter [Verrucomicrobiae bacterium]
MTEGALSAGRTPLSLRSLYLVIGTWTAAIGPFSAVILRSHGLDPATIGLLSAAAALAATVAVPAWGHLADVLVGRAYAFRIGVAVASAAAFALLLPIPPLLLAPILASFTAFPAMFLALGDALAVGGLPSPERQYGALRALASLSFAIGVIVAGFIYDQAGYAAVPIVCLAWSGLIFVLIGRVPDPTRDPAVRAIAARHGGDAAAGRFGSISRAFAVQPRLWAVLAVLTVAHTGVLGAMVFVAIRIVELGGQPSDVALTFGIASFAEIPGLVLAGWLGRRIGLRWLFVVACLASGLCVASWGMLPTPIAINATRLITGLCFGALSAGRVVVIARLLPPELQATGQTLAQAATFGLGNVLGGIIGGVLYGSFGPTAFFAAAGAMSIAGGLGAWVVLYGPVGAPAIPRPGPLLDPDVP